MSNWTVNDIPSQAGKLAVVTGATGGLGYETALALAGAGAEVVLAGRNAAKGTDALARILVVHPKALARFEVLDLASLGSVADFADRLLGTGAPIDILVNNAGVMAPPMRTVTADGFEIQFETNYLGHFALTSRLLPALQRRPGSRVVSVSSIAARNGEIAFDNLQSERYRAWPSYSQSKLACLMVALELHRRSTAGGWGITSIAAHPGISGTQLIANGPGSGGVVHALVAQVMRLSLPLFGQSAAQGALPQLYAATAPDAGAGAYYGPDGAREIRGYPQPAELPARASDRSVAARLWQVSEALTRTPFPALSMAA